MQKLVIVATHMSRHADLAVAFDQAGGDAPTNTGNDNNLLFGEHGCSCYRWQAYSTEKMIELMGRGFAPIAAILSFVAGNRGTWLIEFGARYRCYLLDDGRRRHRKQPATLWSTMRSLQPIVRADHSAAAGSHHLLPSPDH